MTWNFRMIHRERRETGEHWYALHEIYYDADNKIVNYSSTPIAAQGETIGELRADLDRMLAAANKPVLEWDDLETLT